MREAEECSCHCHLETPDRQCRCIKNCEHCHPENFLLPFRFYVTPGMFKRLKESITVMNQFRESMIRIEALGPVTDDLLDATRCALLGMAELEPPGET